MEKPTNPRLRRLVKDLRKKEKEQEAQIWGDLAERLNKSNKSRAEVNVSTINRNTEENDTVVIPGKVLGSGKLDHSVKVAAFDFSERAVKRIQETDGRIIDIRDLMKDNPKGNNVKIME